MIGGGVGGCSIAYHLAKLGVQDVVLVEQFELTYGSTWHSAGLVGQLRSSVSLTRMMMYSVELYAALRRETGKDPGWHELGGIRLASSPARLEEIQRQAGWAKTFGLPLEIISAAEAQERFPLLSTDGVLGAAFLPRDGYLDPSQLTFALADGARHYGAEINTRTRVTAIERDTPGHVLPRVHGQGRDRGRGRRERGRHGGAGRGAARRRDGADHPDGAPVPDHRAVRAARSSRCRRCATPTTSSTGARRWAGS